MPQLEPLSSEFANQSSPQRVLPQNLPLSQTLNEPLAQLQYQNLAQTQHLAQLCAQAQAQL